MIKLEKKVVESIKKIYKEKRYIKNPVCYFYDLSAIVNNIKNLENNLPQQIDLYYAMKANNNPKIMEYVSKHPYVKGIEIASYGELKQAKKYRSNKEIIFTGPGKTDYELEEAIKSGIKTINVESITEAVRINNFAKKHHIANVDVLIRINVNYYLIGVREHMVGCSTKMWIDENECIDSMKYIQKLDRITIKGVHVFAASGVLDSNALILSNKYIFRLVSRIEKEVCNISIIDFGGGLGIDYTKSNRLFDIVKYGHDLTKLIHKYNFEDKRIFMELGTYMVGNCGYYTAKIIDIKKVKGKKHIIIAGGVNQMGLPLEMRRKHPVEIIPMHERKLYDEQPYVSKEKADISGPLCMVSDKLSWNTFINRAEIGDIVVFFQSGAYCYSEGMHKCLSHFYPDEIIIE